MRACNRATAASFVLISSRSLLYDSTTRSNSAEDVSIRRVRSAGDGSARATAVGAISAADMPASATVRSRFLRDDKSGRPLSHGRRGC